MSDETQLGGRTGHHSPVNVAHYFGTFGTPGATLSSLANYPSDFDQEEHETWSSRGACPRLWLVGAAAREVCRYDENPLSPLTRSQVRSLQGIAEPFSYREDTQLKLRVRVVGGPADRPLYLDVGQQLEVVAAAVVVQAMVPDGWVEVPPGNPSVVAPQAGLVGDVVMGAWSIEIEESIGHRDAQLTETLFIPANESRSLRIPPGARELQVFASGLEATLPELRFYAGNLNALTAGYRLAAVTFTAGFETQRVKVPAATHVVTESVANDVFLTFVWTIRP